MKIAQIFENDIDEDFKSMSQKATNIQQGKGAVDNSQLRQQRISQLSQAQAARNANPAGKPMNTTQPATTAAPAQAATAQTTAEPAAQQQAEPAAKPGLTQRVTGALRKAGDVGAAVTGAVGNVGAGFFGGMKRGYSQQASGGAPVSWSSQGSAPAGQSPAFATSQTGGASGGVAGTDRDVAALSARVDALEKALQQRGAVAEEFKFHSNFLGRDI